jgi:hypothetical protein
LRTAPTNDLDRIRALAESLDCWLPDDVALLTGVTLNTTEAWRKRGKGPSYVMAGNRILYPRAAVAAFLAAHTRERTSVATKDAL